MLNEIDIVSALPTATQRFIMCGGKKLAPKSLRSLHAIKAGARHRLTELIIRASSYGISHRNGKSGRPHGTDGIDHGGDSAGRQERPHRIVDEDHVHRGRCCVKSCPYGRLSRGAARNDGAKLRQVRCLQHRPHGGKQLVRNGDDEVVNVRMGIEREQRLHQQRSTSQHPELLSFTTQSRSLAGSRHQDSAFV